MLSQSVSNAPAKPITISTLTEEGPSERQVHIPARTTAVTQADTTITLALPPPASLEALRRTLIQKWRVLSSHDTARANHLLTLTHHVAPTIDTDIVAQGILSARDAEYRLCLYQNTYHEKIPIVSLPPVVTVDMLRRDTPMLFLTIMAIASGAVERSGEVAATFETALKINCQFIDILIFETMVLGKRSVELLKCLILANVWYNSPEILPYQKAQVLTEMCLIMTREMGIGGCDSTAQLAGITGLNSRSEAAAAAAATEVTATSKLTLLRPSSYECRKLWLTVYISCVNVSAVLKRHSGSLWTRYTEECCEVLAHDSRPMDERQTVFVARLNRILEQIMKYMSGPTPPDVSDPRTQALVQHFERVLDTQFPPARVRQSKTSIITVNLVRLVLHEAVLHGPFSPKEGRAPFSEYSLRGPQNEPLDPDSARSFGTVRYAATEILVAFSEFPVDQLGSTPMLLYSRIVLAAASLLKLRALAAISPAVRAVCAVADAALAPVHAIIAKLDAVTEQFPFANGAATYAIVLRLLLCHHHSFIREEQKTGHIESESESDSDIEAEVDGKKHALSVPAFVPAKRRRHEKKTEETSENPVPEPEPMRDDNALPIWLRDPHEWRGLMGGAETLAGFELSS